MKTSSNPRRIDATHAALRWMLALLACVSLLQIPVPMRHHHDRFTRAEDLAAHVQHQHHGNVDDNQGRQHDSFHWHLMLPRDFDGDGQDSDDGVPLDVLIEKVVEGSSNFSCGRLLHDRCVLETLSLSLNPASLIALSALKDRPGRLPLDVSPAVHACAVLCVMRV